MNDQPHWYVLGAGAMGTLIRWHLAEAQLPATLLHHRAGEQRRSLTAQGQQHPIAVRALEHCAPQSIARLIITTKAGQVAAALDQATPYLRPDAVVLTTANGLGFEREIEAFPTPLLRAVTTAAAYRNDEHRVTLISSGRTRVGNPDASGAAPDWFTSSLAQLPGWEWSGTIMEDAGHKFALNCAINALTAVQRCRNGELLEQDRAGSALAALCAECEPVLRELGLWGDAPLLDRAVEVCRSTAANRSSMLQDVLAGRDTEIKYLNGELVRRAAPAPLPLNQALVHTLAHLSAARD